MSKARAKIRVSFVAPADVVIGMDRAAKNAGLKRRAMLVRVLRTFLSSDDNSLILRPLPESVQQLNEAQRDAVDQRRVILDAWAAEKAAARKDGRGVERATAAFLERLRTYQGVRVSRRTLQRWRQIRSTGGDVALVDRRTLERPKAVAA